MIIITKVETIETDKDFHTVIKMAHDYSKKYIPFGKENIECEFVREHIHGRRFVDTRRGIDIIMGITGEAGEKLGLMYECWENMENEKERFRIENKNLIDNIYRIQHYGFFKRLKCLFVGIK